MKRSSGCFEDNKLDGGLSGSKETSKKDIALVQVRDDWGLDHSANNRDGRNLIASREAFRIW